MAGERPYTGLTASVKLGEDPSREIIAYVSGVDMNLDREIIEILAFGMKFKEKVAAIADWSASIDGTVALSASGTQKKLYDAFNAGSAVTIGVYLDENTFFEGSAIVQSFGVSAAPDDKISMTAELAGTGATELTIGGGG